MDIFTTGSADSLFNAALNQSANMDNLAGQALSGGIDKYMAKDYEGAAKDFKRAFGLSPYSSFAYDATKFSSMAYQALGETGNAIKAYERAIQVNPLDDRLQLEMGNLLFGQERYGEAIEAYEAAVRLYDDSTNRFSLGQAYMKTKRFKDAENQFAKIISMGGDSVRNGYFGMGQAYREQGRYIDSISQFERAMQVDSDFYEAYTEMGYTYADAGMMVEAEAVKAELQRKDPGAANLLSKYMNKVTQPRIMLAYADSSFKYMITSSPISAMNDYLANANSEMTFHLTFQFDKDMDRDSVENIFNWKISRSTESAPGMRYNHGLPVASTEISPPPLPIDVYYDPERLTATIRFNLAQNETADGTIDPKHIVFSFSGVDAEGNTMDADYDQFMGFSGAF